MCETVIYRFDAGTFSVQGDQLTLTPSRARAHRDLPERRRARVSPTPSRGPVKVDKDPLLGAARITVGGVAYIRVVPR